MPPFRAVTNTGHALAWTAFMCTVGVSVYTATSSRPLFRRMTRFWAHGLARGWGMEVRVEGAENVDPNGAYVVVANHLSHVDIVALFVALPIDVGFLAKKELKNVPFLGPAMVAGGHVFIDRQRQTSAMRSMQKAGREVTNGASLVIFPEGTRGHEDVVQPFKKGAFHLTRQAGVPIVPVGLRGTRQLMPRDAYTIRPGTVSVHIGKPIAANAFADVGTLSNYVREQIGKLANMPLAPTPLGAARVSAPSEPPRG